MHVRDIGSGPPVVLLHGQPGRGDDWDPIVERLRDRFRLLVPDRPGYGRSPGPARGLFANADDLAGVLAERVGGPVTVAGHSWGGGVALALALRQPAMVRALVLAASIGAASSIDVFDRVLATPFAGEVMAFAGLRLMAPILLVPGVRTLLRPITGPAIAGGLTAPVPAWRAGWRSFSVEQRAMVREVPAISRQLGQIQAPATVVVGGADRLVPARAAHDLAGALPRGELVKVDGAGHLLQYDAPDRLAALIAARARGEGGTTA